LVKKSQPDASDANLGCEFPELEFMN